jgi:putative radical SAM enzyme (TIGR03279 family)
MPETPSPTFQMNAVLSRVPPEAAELGLQPGDRIVSVNGHTDLEDLLDFQFQEAISDVLSLHVVHPDGSEELLEIEKDSDESLGLQFQSPLFTPVKTCNNRCPFCFIDQQPEGLRPTLYVKDDDYRLSYFNGTYITLTNLTPRDKERIARLRPGPFYISVHATDPEVRSRMLLNPKGGDILKDLRWLKSLDIPFHCQLVICPGENDGPVLTRTLKDLRRLRPQALSVAIVPVGLTQHRSNLPTLTPVTPAMAGDIIDQVTALGYDDWAYLSDEFYFRAGRPLPDSYEEFPQLEDGVGTGQALLESFYALALPEKADPPQRVVMLTGRLAAEILTPIAQRLNQIPGMFVDVLPVSSRFWGESVDVAGLITGQDLIDALASLPAGHFQAATIPAVMLKADTDLFLDGLSLQTVSERIGLPIRVVADPYSARCLVDVLFSH